VARVFSGIKPTGRVTLGNYLGALSWWVRAQAEDDCVYCVVDLHALTVPHDPAELRALSLEQATVLLAAGIDPERSILFLQSHVSAHSELAWLMECTAGIGELRRMTQFKEKSDHQEFVSAGLFTYPALMAADILLYRSDVVPVGDDQRQHLELARDLAERFNHRYGPTLVVPEAGLPVVAARVMDLQEPTRKMSKSEESHQGVILVLEDESSISRKIRRAVTDTGTDVRFDPETKPGVSNLLAILGAATGEDPVALAGRYSRYGPLKADCADAVVEMLRPVRARYAELAGDPGAVADILAEGAARASELAGATLAAAKEAVGLLPPGALRGGGRTGR
jgi:tryptophanyl-tRNA synthetase